MHHKTREVFVRELQNIKSEIQAELRLQQLGRKMGDIIEKLYGNNVGAVKKTNVIFSVRSFNELIDLYYGWLKNETKIVTSKSLRDFSDCPFILPPKVSFAKQLKQYAELTRDPNACIDCKYKLEIITSKPYMMYQITPVEYSKEVK